jgi:hypothetical protein
MKPTANNENTHLVPFTVKELREIQMTFVKQMIHLAETDNNTSQLKTLGDVVRKCSRYTGERSKRRRRPPKTS